MRSTERIDRPKSRLPGWLMIGALRVYQLSLSPVFYALGVRCRHEPSCSHYAIGAIRGQGAWRGFWLTLGRLLRCRPGGTFGFDPVPPMRKDTPWWRVWALRPRFSQQGQDRFPPAGRADDKDM
ncbi:membrane protein insertion efficiency factor YidD [Maricaulis sp.]|jgi:hypothetical protein|uniref:membrane protein insertion efficiency factor YidD n=1 Tax=Maricaulis sp. TaxID=1486257 RepID=UPI00262EDEC0|nr:membrane protein insertion efficiency factor YidD [Maricaulis sp.]